jgi:hypothetical protein
MGWLIFVLAPHTQGWWLKPERRGDGQNARVKVAIFAIAGERVDRVKGGRQWAFTHSI